MMSSTRPIMPAPRDTPSPVQKVRQVWTPEEDQLLSEAVAKETPKHGPVSWHKVASHLPGRNNKDCRKRWHYSIANTIRKGTWMREEDERLREAVERYGARWSKIAEAVGTRNGDQCWKRWYDCLDPRIDKSPWTPEEDAKLLHLVSHTGRNWSDIVHQHFPNRTSLAAKNRYSILRRKQDGPSSSSSSPPSSMRHAKATAHTAGFMTATATAASTPSLTSGSSPYLGFEFGGMMPTTPSTTACTTPEPEFAASASAAAAAAAGEMAGDEWMALAEAEIDGLLYHHHHHHHHHHHQGGQNLAGVAPTSSAGEGWYTGTTASPQMGAVGTSVGYDAGVSVASWTTTAAAAAAAGVGDGSGWVQQQHGHQTGFEGGFGDSQMQMSTTTAAGVGGYGGAAGYYGQGEMLVDGGAGYGYGENMLGVYQDGQSQMPQQGMYDGGSGMVDQEMGRWQTGYGTGGW